MISSILAAFLTAIGKPPKLVCSADTWDKGVAELRRRTRGRIEAGAFLLGAVRGSTRVIDSFLFYDDIDPNCFNRGIVEFDGRKLGAVWKICSDRSLSVVADVHVHPGGYGQSDSDQANPIIAETGHLAVILPNFAKCRCRPGKIGIYEYRGNRQWKNWTAKSTRFFHVGWWRYG